MSEPRKTFCIVPKDISWWPVGGIVRDMMRGDTNMGTYKVIAHEPYEDGRVMAVLEPCEEEH